MIFSSLKKLKKRNSLSPERVLIACVAENSETYSTDVLYLFRSLAAFGGSLAHATRIAYFVEAADMEIVEELGQLGVIVKTVDRFDKRCPHANKIRMLEEQEDYDVLVALDCDVVIARDFLPELDPNVVMAKPADMDPLTTAQWEVLFQQFNLPLPPKRYLTTTPHVKEMIPYFNSGVICIPKRFVSPLSKAWQTFVHALWDIYDRFPEMAAHSFFTDQFALSLTLINEKIPFNAFPLEMNFPDHCPIHP